MSASLLVCHTCHAVTRSILLCARRARFGYLPALLRAVMSHRYGFSAGGKCHGCHTDVTGERDSGKLFTERD